MNVKRIFYVMVFSCLMFAVKCQDNAKVAKIEFTTLTRGYHKQVFISPDSLITTIEARGNENKIVTRKLDTGEWRAIVETIHDIFLTDIPDLKSPTFQRAFDGARHSTIVISTLDGNTYTHSFDDENPHEKLQPLMQKILDTEASGKEKE